jgi:hypothetical protein
VDLRPVHGVEGEVVIAVVRHKGFGLGIKPVAQHRSQLLSPLGANVSHYEKHRILHRRVIDRAPVPDAPIDHDVETGGDNGDLRNTVASS